MPLQQTYPDNGEGLASISVKGLLVLQWERFRVVGGLLEGEEVLGLWNLQIQSLRYWKDKRLESRHVEKDDKGCLRGQR